MKMKLAMLGAVIITIVGLFIVSNIKTEETVLSARYQMLACEKCYHMTVENSKNKTLIGETIIPVSSTIDIERMIDSVALSKEPLCLKGKLYRFNPNFLNFSPGGKRFEVISQEDLSVCLNL